MVPQRQCFFPGDDPALETLRQEIRNYLDWLKAEAASVPGCRALLLGGGYGRGEGGVLHLPEQPRPMLYNDLEFYLFAEGEPAGGFLRWSEEGERRLHLEIEFKRLAPGAFAAARPSMFYYDLLCGHVAVVEDRAWLNSLPASLARAEMIPPTEGSRLLINRAMSLPRCFAAVRGEEEVARGFVDRIFQKCQLALGDAVLCAEGQYHWSCVERDRRLPLLSEVPMGWSEVVERHCEAVRFKFHPWVSDLQPQEWEEKLASLARLWVKIFLWLEARRLGAGPLSASDYARLPQDLFPEEGWWKNALRQVRDAVRGQGLLGRLGRHPRELVWRSLPLLLTALVDSSPASESQALAARLLHTAAIEVPALAATCRKLWQRYP